MWSVAKVSSYVGVTPRTVYRWIKEGKIVDYRMIGRTVRIPQSEVQRIMNDKRGEIINQDNN